MPKVLFVSKDVLMVRMIEWLNSLYLDVILESCTTQMVALSHISHIRRSLVQQQRIKELHRMIGEIIAIQADWRRGMTNAQIVQRCLGAEDSLPWEQEMDEDRLVIEASDVLVHGDFGGLELLHSAETLAEMFRG